jgi:hypothetical protein
MQKKTARKWRDLSSHWFKAVLRYSCSETYKFISTKQGFNLMRCVSVHGHTKDHPVAPYNLPIMPSTLVANLTHCREKQITSSSHVSLRHGSTLSRSSLQLSAEHDHEVSGSLDCLFVLFNSLFLNCLLFDFSFVQQPPSMNLIFFITPIVPFI